MNISIYFPGLAKILVQPDSLTISICKVFFQNPCEVLNETTCYISQLLATIHSRVRAGSLPHGWSKFSLAKTATYKDLNAWKLLVPPPLSLSYIRRQLDISTFGCNYVSLCTISVGYGTFLVFASNLSKSLENVASTDRLTDFIVQQSLKYGNITVIAVELVS